MMTGDSMSAQKREGLFPRKQVQVEGSITLKSQGHHWGVRPLEIEKGDVLNLMRADNLPDKDPNSRGWFVMEINGEETTCHYGYLVSVNNTVTVLSQGENAVSVSQ